jgi:hypothetical protein
VMCAPTPGNYRTLGFNAHELPRPQGLCCRASSSVHANQAGSHAYCCWPCSGTPVVSLLLKELISWQLRGGDNKQPEQIKLMMQETGNRQQQTNGSRKDSSSPAYRRCEMDYEVILP